MSRVASLSHPRLHASSLSFQLTVEQQMRYQQEKAFDPSPLLQDDKVTNSSFLQMFAEVLHLNCSSNHSEGMLKLLQFLVTTSVKHQII